MGPMGPMGPMGRRDGGTEEAVYYLRQLEQHKTTTPNNNYKKVETPHVASLLMSLGGGLFLGEGAEALTEDLGALHDVDKGVRVDDVEH